MLELYLFFLINFIVNSPNTSYVTDEIMINVTNNNCSYLYLNYENNTINMTNNYSFYINTTCGLYTFNFTCLDSEGTLIEYEEKKVENVYCENIKKPLLSSISIDLKETILYSEKKQIYEILIATLFIVMVIISEGTFITKIIFSSFFNSLIAIIFAMLGIVTFNFAFLIVALLLVSLVIGYTIKT